LLELFTVMYTNRSLYFVGIIYCNVHKHEFVFCWNYLLLCTQTGVCNLLELFTVMYTSGSVELFIIHYSLSWLSDCMEWNTSKFKTL